MERMRVGGGFMQWRYLSVSAAPKGLLAVFVYGGRGGEVGTQPVIALAVKESWMSNHEVCSKFQEGGGDWGFSSSVVAMIDEGGGELSEPNEMTNFVGLRYEGELTESEKSSIVKSFGLLLDAREK